MDVAPKTRKAFQKVKDLLIAAPVLTHYDLDKALILACDAFPGVLELYSHSYWKMAVSIL